MQLLTSTAIAAVACMSFAAAAAGPVLAQQPALDEGAEASPAGTMLQARESHSATLLPDGRVLVVGGSHANDYLSTVEIWDPTTRTFESTGSLTAARSGHSAFVQPDGTVLVVGGWGGAEHRPVAEAELWSPETGEFVPAGALDTPRMEATTTELADGRVLVVGGRFHDDEQKAEPVVEAEVWDPATRSFGPAGSIVHLREYHSTLALPDGGAIVIGGGGREVLYWNPVSNAFESAGRMAEPRDGGVLLADGRVLAIGVVDPITCKPGRRYAKTPDAELWDPRTFSFESAGAFRQPRRPMDVVALDDGRVLVYGGWNAVCMDSIAFDTAEVWSPDTRTFGRAGATQERRQHHSTTLLPDGRVAFIGGMAEVIVKETKRRTRFADVPQLTVELWDPLTDRFVRAGRIVQPRLDHTATLLHDGSVLLIGGSAELGGPALATAELWVPPATAAGAPQLVPPEVILPQAAGIPLGVAPRGEMTTQRWGHTATLLEDGRVLITGGADGGPAELFDPATGMFNSTGSMSESRVYHTATRLADGRVLVFGGLNEPATAEIYDPATGRFSLTGAPVTDRGAGDAILLKDGRVLGVSHFSAELYDPDTETFSLLPEMSRVKGSDRLANLPDGRVLVVGANRRRGQAEAELFDPVSTTFSPLVLERHLTEGQTLTSLPDGRALVAAGWGDRGAIHLFDPASATFELAGRLKILRGGHQAVALPDGRVLIIGGQARQGPTRSIEAFDPATGISRRIGRLREVRDDFTATLLDDGRVLVAGGGAGSEGGRAPRHAEILDPETGRTTFAGQAAGGSTTGESSDP